MSINVLISDRLAQRSVEVLLAGQHPGGGYIASPNFPQYEYAWLRDGAFCALALHYAGEPESVDKFHAWVAETVGAHRQLFIDAIDQLSVGILIPPEMLPPTRFHLDGSLETDHHESWPNYQLDGYGTWLAVLQQTESEPSEKILDAVRIVADLLAVAWELPCFDCWEESGDEIHGSTLLAVAGGLASAAELLSEKRYKDIGTEVLKLINERFTLDGTFVKRVGDNRVDASLAWAALPHRAFRANDPVVVATVERMRSELGGPNRGIRRYIGDSYYGGGDWVLLTALVGWHDAVNGNRDQWEHALAWIRSVADADYLLPEQVLLDVQKPEMIQEWLERWGAVAKPLLWSHAMYLIMVFEGEARGWL